MSFTATLDNLVSTLTNDAALQAFATAAWGKPITVHAGYKQRMEIGAEELPVIRITRPQVEPDTKSANRIALHKVRLYCGFYQPDLELAVSETIQYEELIRAALVVDRRRGQTAQATVPGDSANDEGTYHPSYFLVMDVDIQTYDHA
jgi:hypothetical protein